MSRTSLRSRGLRVLVATTLAAALGGALLAPSAAEAQARQPKQRVRISATDRKAAAEARKAKMDEWKKSGGAKGAGARGGAR